MSVAVLAVDVLDDLDGVGGRHAVVGLGLDLGRRVDVHDDDRAGVLGLPGAQLVGGDRVRERAARVQVRQQHGLLGREHRRRLGHEVHAAERDHVGVGRRRLLREAERVADEVGHVLHLGQLVVVGEDDGAALGGQRAYLVLQGGDGFQRQEVHGSVSRISERSRTGAEWVSAPDRHVVYTRNGRIDQNCLFDRSPPLTPRARPGRPPGRPRRAPRRASCCRAAAGRRPASSASSISAASRTSTASRQVRPRRRARAAPPRRRRRASAEWFSLMRMKSKSPIRWLTPPPSATAAFSSAAQPGRRLARVEDLRAAAVADRPHHARRSRSRRRTAGRGSSAPSARRSAAPAREPSTRSTRHRASRHSPSGPRRSIVARPGRAAGRRPRPTPSPEMTPGAFCVIVARPRASASTVASVVTSPSPTSSASARSIRSDSVVNIRPARIAE